MVFNKIRILTFIILLLALSLFMGVVSAANGTISSLNGSEVYVAVNGSDEAGNGSVGNPYKSLKSALGVAGNGSTIYMFNGTYSGLNNAKLTVDKKLTISSLDGTVTLDGGKNHNFFYITPTGNLTLKGLKLINGSDGDDYTAGAVVNQGQLTIINSTLSGSTGFLAGAVLNHGNLTVLDSTFKANNGTNYAGGISNFGLTNIQNSQFIDTGVALFNTGNMTIVSSNFTSSSIRCDNFNNTKNTVTITNSSFKNAVLTSKNNTIYMYNSTFDDLPSYSNAVGLDSSNATITGSSFSNSITTDNGTLNIIHSVMSSYISTGANSTLNVSYSVILGGIYTGENSTAYAPYNWWGSNKKPDFSYSNVIVDRWIIMTFTSNKTPIPSKTNVTVTAALNKYTDGKNIFNLGEDVYLPSRYVSFETDNGFFSPSEGYLVNRSFSTNYLNNTEDTWIYACIDNLKLRLVVGTGWTDYSIYVSNDGDDYYGDGSKNNPYKTLQRAVSKALNGNKIYLFAGNYNGLYNTDLYINKYLTFSSFNGKVSMYRHSNLNLFNITEFGQLNLNNLNIYSEMSYNVLLINNNGVLVLNNCTIANSTGCIGGNGGVTEVYNSKFYNIIGRTIHSNNITIVNSSFSDISLPSLYNDNDGIIRSYGNLKITNSTFSNSNSPGYSNFIRSYIQSHGNLTVINSTFSNNNIDYIIAARGGSNSSSLISGSTFVNNTGSVSAGTVENCTFVNNTGLSVGASINNSLFINNTGSPVVRTSGYISNSIFINNSNTLVIQNHENYTNYGVVSSIGNLTVTGCIFLNNFAAYGGAIYNTGNLVVSYSVFVNNTAKYLGDDIYNRMGTAYLLLNWWGSNSGPTSEKVYRFLGDVYAYNWVILTLTANGNVLKASLDKVTDVNGTVRSLGGVLPSREVFFDGEVGISPKKANLVDNHASATITSGSEKDFRVNATVDNQTVDLTVRNTSTVIDVDNAAFYGKGNLYKIVLRNVNGYLISNQTLKITITDQNGKSQVYTLVTDDKGVATLTVDNPVGVYRVVVVYSGDGYFKGSQAEATIQVLTAITRIIGYDETFYGKENFYYATLFDVNGKGIPGQKLTFTITYGKQSKSYTVVTDDSGRVGVLIDFPQGKYNVKVSYAGNSWYGSSTSTSSFTVYSIKSVLKLLTSVVYGRGNPFAIELRDGKGNVIRNETVVFTISQGNSSQTFNLTTDENGITGLMINLYPGIYNVTAKYNGGNLYAPSSVNGTLTINKVNTKLRADSVISNFKGIYSVILTDIYDRPLVGESVSLKVIHQKFNATYSVITDSNGVARFVLILDIGNYAVVNNFNANSWYGSTTGASTLIVSNTSANNFFVYDYLTNAQIQYVLDNSKENSNVVFSKGKYDKLSLKVSKPVNIRGNGVVTILGGGSGVAFTITGNNVSIRGLIIQNYTTGILNRANNVTIINNTFKGNVNGLVNYGNGSGVKINTNNVFQSNKGSAIYNYGKNLTLKGLKLVNNKIGITNKGSNVDIPSNTITGGEYGIVNNAASADINYNKISKASKYGIQNTGSNTRMRNNTLQNNNYGIYNTGSGSTISSNTVTSGDRGVVNKANTVTITKNTVKSVKTHGIYNTAGSKNKITNNNLTGLNKGYGVYLDKGVKSGLVQGNTISKFSYGVLNAGTSNTLKSNTLKSNNIGVSVSASAKSTQIASNTISGGSKGVVVNGASVTVSKNTVKSVKSQGIYSNGSKNKITNNNLTGLNKGYGVYLGKKAKSNVVQGNKVNKFSYGLLSAGTSNTIKSNTLKSNNIGVSVSASAKSTQVTSNTITGGSKGIVVKANSISINKNTIKSVKSQGIYSNGSKNKITNNNLTGLNKGYGVYLDKKAKSNQIQGNKITKFSYGILEKGTSNTIKSNTLTSNKNGLSLSTSARNTQVTSNKINKNSNYGIYNKGRNTNIYKNTLTSNKYGLVTVKSVKNTINTMKGNKVNIKTIK